LALLAQPGCWVDGLLVLSKLQGEHRCVTTHGADRVARGQLLTDLCIDHGEAREQELIAVAGTDDHQVAVGPELACEDDQTIAR
jgi:hypothetical protein